MDFARRAATDARLLARSCESLLGICSGLIADGNLNDLEIKFLRTWLTEHVELATTWPGEVLCLRIENALADGVITEVERTHLQDTLHQLIGGSFIETGAVPAAATTLPIDERVEVVVPQESFCFTGQFIFGTRSACERAVQDRGGTVAGVKHALSYLVIGELSSRDWKFSSYGTKIENALDLKTKGSKVSIVSEAQWARALR